MGTNEGKEACYWRSRDDAGGNGSGATRLSTGIRNSPMANTSASPMNPCASLGGEAELTATY